MGCAFSPLLPLRNSDCVPPPPLGMPPGECVTDMTMSSVAPTPASSVCLSLLLMRRFRFLRQNSHGEKQNPQT